MSRAAKSSSKIQMLPNAGDDSQMPAQTFIRPLTRNGFNRATPGLVVTDLTVVRRSEELL